MVTRQFVFQRHACLAAFFVLLFAFPTWAQVSPPANPAPADSAPANTAPGFGIGTIVAGKTPMAPKKRTPTSETAKHTIEMLDTVLELGQVDSPLSDFAKFLSDEGVPTLLDQRGLKIAGQTGDLKLTASFASTPLRTALRKLLQPHHLHAIVDEDGLVITADFEQLTLAGIGVTQSVTSNPKDHDALLAKLQQKVSVTFIETPLEEAAKALSKQISATIIIDRWAIEEIGVTPDTPVNIELKSVSLQSALRLMLRDLTLTYLVKDEVIQITTMDAAERNLVNQIHFLESTGFDLQGNAIQVIETTIAPDTWEAFGGPSTMAPLFVGPYQRPAILISTTTDVHAQISDLFKTLRTADSK